MFSLNLQIRIENAIGAKRLSSFPFYSGQNPDVMLIIDKFVLQTQFLNDLGECLLCFLPFKLKLDFLLDYIVQYQAAFGVQVLLCLWFFNFS